jgi:uncharacterized membrane protein YphA (DoxX/SURF4 family)
MSQTSTRRIYWTSTALLALLMLIGGTGNLLHLQPFVENIRGLGYPEYVLTLLGVSKLLGTASLLYPAAPRLKEWAYAGFVFDLGGALISHLVSGSSPTRLLSPAVCLTLVALSYAAQRRLHTITARCLLPQPARACPANEPLRGGA